MVMTHGATHGVVIEVVHVATMQNAGFGLPAASFIAALMLARQDDVHELMTA